jgi:hypothetical protein
MKGASNMLIAVLILLLSYAVFWSYHWGTGKRRVFTANGKQVTEVMVHEGDLIYYTRSVWKPAFWCMEHWFGYQYGGYLAMHEDSAFVFYK